MRAVSRAIDGERWQNIVDALPGIARYAQEAKTTTFSASLAARIELALKTVRDANGIDSASEQIYQLTGAGTSTIESVPAAIAMVELAGTDPNRCAILCANLGGDTDTIGAMATAICGALHGVQAIDPALKAELDAVNQLDFGHYCENCCTSGSKGRAYECICPTSRHPARHAPGDGVGRGGD